MENNANSCKKYHKLCAEVWANPGSAAKKQTLMQSYEEKIKTQFSSSVMQSGECRSQHVEA